MSDSSTTPTCYRHPDRESYIRCSRCERFICPDCRIDAAVGFQCPECVREGSKAHREWRTEYGGRTTGDPTLVTKILLGINLAVFALQLVYPPLTSRFWQVGLRIDEQGELVGVAAGEFYRLLTAGFLHAPRSVFHILFNMGALWMLGPPLEAVLGRVRFLSLYLIALLGGSAVSYAIGDADQASVGASGAIFGLFAAHLVVARRRGLDATQLYVVLGINFAFGFLVPLIDWQAHLGGLVTGGLTAAVLVYAPRAARAAVQIAGSAAVLLVVLTIVAVRTAQLI